MEELQDTIITLLDEQEKPVRFDLLMTFDYEGKRYAAMLPVDPVEGVGEDEVVLLEIARGKEGELYQPIQNPILLDEVFDEFQELFEEEISANDEE